MSRNEEDLQALSDSLARRTALLDQLQSLLELNRDSFSEEKLWDLQAVVDETRFAVELDRLVLIAKLSE